MARYKNMPAGVFDADTGKHVRRQDPEWLEYEAWLTAGNIPDPPDPPATPSLQQRRAERAALVNLLRDEKASSGVTFDGNSFDTDPVSRANLTGAVASAGGGGGGLPPGLQWRTADNQLVAMNPQKLAQLGRAVLDHVNACYVRSWALKDAIAASNDPESIDITAGWPS